MVGMPGWCSVVLLQEDLGPFVAVRSAGLPRHRAAALSESAPCSGHMRIEGITGWSALAEPLLINGCAAANQWGAASCLNARPSSSAPLIVSSQACRGRKPFDAGGNAAAGLPNVHRCLDTILDALGTYAPTFASCTECT